MLVLTRKKDQAIVINENIEITVLEIKGDQVKIGISAPKEVAVFRKELLSEIQNENRAASVNNEPDLSVIVEMLRNQNKPE